jgi:hypothetical protein
LRGGLGILADEVHVVKDDVNATHDAVLLANAWVVRWSWALMD